MSFLHKKIAKQIQLDLDSMQLVTKADIKAFFNKEYHIINQAQSSRYDTWMHKKYSNVYITLQTLEGNLMRVATWLPAENNKHLSEETLFSKSYKNV